MNKLIAVGSFVLSLYGCDAGGSTFVHRTQAGGGDTLYSKVVAQAGITRFECVRSASGRCYYTVIAAACAPAMVATGVRDARGGRCRSQDVQHFAVADGDVRLVPGLQGFRLCVSAEDAPAGPECEAPATVATRPSVAPATPGRD